MSTPRRRVSEGERVELMLCVLPWIAARGGATLTEVAEHFAADPERLRDDLNKVFLDVGTGEIDSMVAVDFDEEDADFVTVTLPGSFEDPPELDHSEALLLLAAGTAMAGVHGAGAALEPALDKLVALLGEGARSALLVDLGSGDPQIRELLAGAVQQRRRVSIEYFSWGSDEVRSREVDPWALRSVEGHWYLSGWCHDRQDLRHFRLDRVLAAEAVGAPGAFDAPDSVDPPDSGLEVGGRSVDLRIPQEAAWILDSYPVDSWRDDGTELAVTLRVHNDAWLDRLLMRLPAQSTAHDADSGEDLLLRRAEVARQVLARHDVHGL